MKLISLFIKNYSDLIENEAFTFTDEFSVIFDFNTRKLEINKNPTYIEKLYGDTIYNITPVIGKNGSGKTTLLNIIGRTTKDRIASVTLDSNRNICDAYFLLFATNNNIFYIESVNLLPANIDNLNNTEPFYSFYFKKTGNIFSLHKDSTDTFDKINYIIEPYINETNDKSSAFGSVPENLYLPRIINSSTSLTDLYETYLSLLEHEMIYSNLTIEFKKNHPFEQEDAGFVIHPFADEAVLNIGKYFYHISENIADFFLHYFSCIINFYKSHLENKITIDKFGNWFLDFSKECNQNKPQLRSQYESLFKSLTDFVCKAAPEERLLLTYTTKLSELFLSMYEIKDYINPGYHYFKITFPCKKDEKIINFITLYDKFNNFITFHENSYLYNNDPHLLPEDALYDQDEYKMYSYSNEKFHRPPELFAINNFLLSTGEKNLLKLISTLTKSLKSYCQKQPVGSWSQPKTYLVLVDEIENCMHLEWSRKFIYFLSHYLDHSAFNAFDKFYSFKDANYTIQLIFSTHSPFMLSDIANNSFIMLESNFGKISSKSEMLTPFAKNIQEIMHDSFFINDFWGEYAKELIKKMIELLQTDSIPENEFISQKELYQLICQIGEPILKTKLLDMYETKYPIHYKEKKQQELIENIKDLYGELDANAIKNIKDLFLND